MKVKILRQAGPFSKPYWQTFIYEQDMNVSVAAVLDSINYRDNVTDINGNPADLISWECSCLQGMCGGCAMVINGVPKLACDTFLKDLKGGELVLEPLRKFPVISDLVVDRGIIQENLKKANAYIGEYEHDDKYSQELEYQIGRCLKCGLCLEACPNYVKGKMPTTVTSSTRGARAIRRVSGITTKSISLRAVPSHWHARRCAP